MTEEEIKALNEEVVKLRQEKTDLAGEIAARDNRVAEMEQAVNTRDSEMAVLKQNLTELKAQFGGLSEEFSKAIAGYRTLALAANPDIPVELITGDNIGAIDTAVANARSLIGKVKEQLEKAQGQVKVPPGAPQRTPPDLSGLSPREKINLGITKGSKL